MIARSIKLIGQVDSRTREELRNVLIHAYTNFRTYRQIFERRGISETQILSNEPLETLRRLPLLQGDEFNTLVDESVLVGDQMIDMETSSGTTGPRKRRFISYADDVSETKFLAELFAVCGIGPGDRVACLDADPLTLMVSFTKALELIGVDEAYAFCAGKDFDRTLASLPKLDPSVIISIPSVLERCFESLTRHYNGANCKHLEKLVYVGEPIAEELRTRFESSLGVEVFGYYGASETSALGIECAAHNGIHVFDDRNIIEVESCRESTSELVVTTLRQQTLPLLRYALKDTVLVRDGACSCGLKSPRVDVLGRAGDSFSILGAKLYHEPIMKACYNGRDSSPQMQIVLSREEREKLSIVLPKSFIDDAKKLKASVFRSQPDIDFLVGSNYLDIEFRFEEDEYFTVSRKQKKIIDLR